MPTPTNWELKIMLDSIWLWIKSMHRRQDTTNGQVLKNSEFRLKAQGSVIAIKAIVGLIGVWNIVIIIKLFIIWL